MNALEGVALYAAVLVGVLAVLSVLLVVGGLAAAEYSLAVRADWARRGRGRGDLCRRLCRDDADCQVRA